jgi:secondary thiamine-phosphate synthase enzyme
MSKLIDMNIHTEHRNQLVDITNRIQKLVDDSGVRDGVVEIFVPHTTAAVTINENADPTVQSDILGFLEKLIPASASFQHTEGNSDAHIKSSLVGTHQAVFVSEGRLAIGAWQAIYFCEFDGPRSRRVIVKIIPDS